MASPMEDSSMEQEMSRLGLQLIGLLQRRQRAEMDRRYTEVLELEIAMESVHEALTEVAGRLRFEE